MSQRLLVMGCGQVGRAVALVFARAGWAVTVARRTAAAPPPDLCAAGLRWLALDRDDDAALAGAAEDGFDAVVDTVAFHGGHARQWLGLQDHVGALAVISTGSVYADAEGLTLDEASAAGFPAILCRSARTSRARRRARRPTPPARWRWKTPFWRARVSR